MPQCGRCPIKKECAKIGLFDLNSGKRLCPLLWLFDVHRENIQPMPKPKPKEQSIAG